jgi:hypothetical protein
MSHEIHSAEEHTSGDAAVETHCAPPLGSALPPTGHSTRLPFYWEVDDSHLERLRAENSILEDEGYLAHEINRGRRLLDMPDVYVAVPDVRREWEAPDRVERYSDAVAAILQVAFDEGLDPSEVCDAALCTQRSVRRFSESSVAAGR